MYIKNLLTTVIFPNALKKITHLRKGSPPILWVGMSIVPAIMENNMEVSQITKNRNTIQSNNSTSENLPEEKENTNLKRYICTPMFIAVLFTIIANIGSSSVAH